MFVTKLQKLFDMTKPQLVKVRALFYVLQHIIKRDCAYFDLTSSLKKEVIFKILINKVLYLCVT